MKNKLIIGIVSSIFSMQLVSAQSLLEDQEGQNNSNFDYVPTRILGQGSQSGTSTTTQRTSIQERLMRLKIKASTSATTPEVNLESKIEVEPEVMAEDAMSIDVSQPLEHYPHWDIPETVLQTIIADPHLSAYGSLAPDLLGKIQHEVTDPNLSERGVTDLLSVGVTHYGNSSDDRIFNIKHSLFKYDGKIVQPGETFSFLETLGPVTKSEYKETKVILGGESVTGLGGGVCQTSTTMRRAAVFAGLPEGQRKHHSFAVYHYGPLQGLDTAVWQPGLDYEFTNDTAAPILIRVHVEDSHVMVFFYGKKDRDAVLLHQDQTGSIMTGMTSTWKREIYKEGLAEPIVESWTAKYKDYVDGEKNR